MSANGIGKTGILRTKSSEIVNSRGIQLALAGKQGMARYRTTDATERRTAKVTVQLAPTERKQLETAAAREGNEIFESPGGDEPGPGLGPRTAAPRPANNSWQRLPGR